MSIIADGEDYGKIYKCKGWPFTGHCKSEAFSPLNTAQACGGEVCWPVAWTYEGGCTGTIAPTAAPTFKFLSKWVKEGCPPEYVPNNSAYKPEDYVSVPKNEDNTYGVVWQCKNAMTAPWCQQEGYAPGTEYGGQAWEKVGYCDGTISPTASPTPFDGPCQFKYKLDTTDGGEYVVLQAGSWQKGGTTIATVTGGTPLDLYKPGHLVRDGRIARKCNQYPYSLYCSWSPFVQDSSNYNPTLSRLGWDEATCEDVEHTNQASEDLSGKNDEFVSNLGPLFASNGHLLVKKDGTCVNLAINPEDYFKSSPDVKGCQKCAIDNGFGSSADPTLCTPCQGGTTSKIVNGRSQCLPFVEVEFEVAITLDGIEDGSTLSDEFVPSLESVLQASLQLPEGAGLRIVSIGGVSLTGRLLEAQAQGLLVIFLITLVINCSEETCDDSRGALLEEAGDLSSAITMKVTDGSLSTSIEASVGTGISVNPDSLVVYTPTVKVILPSNGHSDLPSNVPTNVPTNQPSDLPSNVPSNEPSDLPSNVPSYQPSDLPSNEPSDLPSNVPSNEPSDLPSNEPSDLPSNVPSELPSLQPTDSIWSQLGADIDGEAAGDRSGISVSLSADGRTVAVGAYSNDGNGASAGHARVYRYDEVDSSWTQLGADIDGEAPYDRSGISVSLSADGRTVAVGAGGNDGNGLNAAGHARVYRYVEVNSSWSWTQLGADLDGEAASDWSGTSVSLSADGNTVAVGAYLNDGNGASAGHARVYRYDEVKSSWSQLGADIDGEAAYDYSGKSVSLSADGRTVAVGASGNDGNGADAGHARVYRYDEVNSSWSKLGADIDGEAPGDYAGISVSLSADGNTVAVGAQKNDGNGASAGHARVYRYDEVNSSWSKLGADIDGEAPGDYAGKSVSLSADGNTVAVGASGNDGNGEYAGHARVYRYDEVNSSWSQLGADIDGEATCDEAGKSVSLSADGNTVAVGADYNGGNGADAGHARVYKEN
eukprot:scaffold491_cov76-Skeletonema_dohrnii-CCMP3373.AAC.1